ncbi:type II toxin-antitoxin system RelE/ParE family toxin [Patescibacteria group bacterium AH-259-L05]|nr:type II toxin-antitoxin system RelE/ParE family toxin [Patescibacteria group bacterium AH-259-L05]
MRQWRFIITDEAEEDLGRLDLPVRKRILHKLNWFINNFDYITPLPLGKPFRGFFKFRVGDWRIVYESAQEKNKKNYC